MELRPHELVAAVFADTAGSLWQPYVDILAKLWPRPVKHHKQERAVWSREAGSGAWLGTASWDVP